MRSTYALALPLAVALLGLACAGDGNDGPAPVTCARLCEAVAACGDTTPGCLEKCEGGLGTCLDVVGADCLACLEACDEECTALTCNCPATCPEICAARDLCLEAPDPECAAGCAEAIGACVETIGGACAKCWDECDANCAEERCVCPS